MAHKRQDTYTPCKEWARHLRPYGKRVQAKAERQFSKEQIQKEVLTIIQETVTLYLQ